MSSTTCAPWATSADACAPCDTYDIDPFDLDDAMQVASDVLFNLTGRQWPGVCSDSIRPQHACTCYRSMKYGVREYGCARVPEIRLPGSPVVPDSVTVLIDGTELDSSAFRIDNRRDLVRLDGQGWPCCQDMTKDANVDDHTMLVEYDWGAAPPIGGRRAAATLGCQYALACNPDAISDGRCRLPKRITTVTRAGTTIAVVDPMTLIKDGMVGLVDVDQWVASIGFGRARRRGRVLIPGRRRSARRTP